MHNKISLLLLAMPFIIFAQKQNYIFQHITTKDGLAAGVMRFVFQDSKGFYWIGYDNGFQKFDGKNFITTSFANKYVTSNLQDAALISPIEDNAGNIYIPNQGSVYIYHPKGNVDTIRVFDYLNDKVSDIHSFCKDEWDNIWVGTNANLYKYDKHNNTCILWASPGHSKIAGKGIKIVYDSSKKNIWAARDDNIFLIDIKNKKKTQPSSKLLVETNLPGDNSIVALWIDDTQNLWISKWNGILYKFNTLTYRHEIFDAFNTGKNLDSIGRSIPICFAEDKQKNIWIGCINGGFYVYNEQTNNIRAVPSNNNVPNAFHYDYDIHCIFRDKESNIWAGTDKGINVFNPYLQEFNNVDENSLGTSFQKPDVTKIFQTSASDILVGSWGKGWLMFDKNFRLKKQFYDITEKGDHRKNFAWCFTQDPTGKIWIGYQYGLIGIFNPINQHIEYISPPEFEKETVMVIRCAATGNIWFGLHSGILAKWDAVQHKFFKYQPSLKGINFTDPINDILIDKQGNLWIASGGEGFYCFNPLEEKVTDYYKNNGANSIIDDEVNSLTQINDTIIGISNKFTGFLLFNQNQKTFNSFSSQNGLPLNDVWGLAKDKQNNMWIATNHGLLRMNSRGNKMVSFDEEDGLLFKKFQGNVTILRDGRMAVPAETGFVFFSPDKINDLPAPPDVTITGFVIYDEPLPLGSALANNNMINLNHTQNFITVNFSSISFTGRNSTQYYYRLEGVDKDWLNAGKRRFADYTNLSPGHYIFKVRCENRDGIPSKNITTLSIYVRPPWWATWWAYACYAMMVSGIAYVLYRNHIQQIRRKQQEQVNVIIATQEEERKRISRDLHDDVGTKLSALKLLLSSLQEKANATNNEDITALAKTSEQFVAEAVNDVRQLLFNLSPAVLEEFGYTVAVEGLINRINESKQIHFSLVIFGMKQRLEKEYELVLYRITQELINNVLKHAEAKNVSLQIGQRDKKIILMIEDDGKGFDIAAHKDGYGLHNLAARTKLLQGIMTIDSHLGKGTSVLIEIPDNFNE